jgi:two-component system sensor histidine kinase/response regulator
VPESPSRPQLLLVDDHRANLIALEALLGTLPVELVSVQSGMEALAAAEQRDFAVILLDVMMPGLDGLATLELLRRLPRARTTPVLFMTALDRSGHSLKRAYALGAVDFIVKPIDPDVLVPKVNVFVTLWQQGQEVARQAERLAAKDRHIGILAHDLRSPLSTVVMAAARLEQSAEASIRELGERITRAATRMSDLATHVLEFARASASRFPLELAEVDLSRLCQELVGDLAATHPNVTFTTELPPESIGRWDPARLQQALSNLITNAIKYGTGWVRVRLLNGSGDVTLIVENGGPPISPQRLDRLFEPFERAAKDGSGVGLGLYIVREIARAHGGEIEVTSDAESTLFRLRLPTGRTVETLKLSLPEGFDAKSTPKSGSAPPVA